MNCLQKCWWTVFKSVVELSSKTVSVNCLVGELSCSLSVDYFIFFYQSFSKFHIWIASIKLSLKFEYEFCPTKVNQDGQRNGPHLLVGTYRHYTLVIYYRVLPNFIYFYQTLAQVLIWALSDNQDGRQMAAICQFTLVDTT